MDLSSIERLMMTLDLKNPMDRFVAILAATDTLIWFLQPSLFFVSGEARKDVLVPWWSVGLVTGALGALFL